MERKEEGRGARVALEVDVEVLARTRLLAWWGTNHVAGETTAQFVTLHQQ